MTKFRRYRNAGADNLRWERFTARPDDIIISTPQKSGTTLLQRLCSLAIFRTPDLDQPLDVVSPWFDQHTRSDEQMLAIVDAQSHRRFLKTHTPLDGVPTWDGVTYLSAARDPRDIFISWDRQNDNIDRDRLVAAFDDGAGLAKVRPLMAPPAATFDKRFDDWLGRNDPNQFSLARHLHHMQYAWERRDAAAMALFHFADLTADPSAALNAVAAAIQVDVNGDELAELSPFAGFEAMRQDAAKLAPNTKGIFVEPERFFRTGKSGAWKDLFTAEQNDRYLARCDQLADPDFLAWLHRGAS